VSVLEEELRWFDKYLKVEGMKEEKRRGKGVEVPSFPPPPLSLSSLPPKYHSFFFPYRSQLSCSSWEDIIGPMSPAPSSLLFSSPSLLYSHIKMGIWTGKKLRLGCLL